MKYAIETSSGAMIYTPSFIKTSLGIQTLMAGIYRHTASMEIAYAYFHFLAYFSKVGLCDLRAVCVSVSVEGEIHRILIQKIKTLLKLILFYLDGLGSLACSHSKLILKL
jgi:hypothetical protein